MIVTYKGKDADYNYRVAEIGFNDDETSVIERISKLMSIKGWNIEIVTDGYALCKVEDREEYTEFMKDWKAAKRCIMNCIKYGF